MFSLWSKTICCKPTLTTNEDVTDKIKSFHQNNKAIYDKTEETLEKEKSGYPGVLERKFRSLSLLTRASLRFDMSREDAMCTLNILQAAPATSVIHQPPDYVYISRMANTREVYASSNQLTFGSISLEMKGCFVGVTPIRWCMYGALEMPSQMVFTHVDIDEEFIVLDEYKIQRWTRTKYCELYTFTKNI